MNELTELVRELVATNSINPDLVPGAPGEGAVARHIAAWLERVGLIVELDDSTPGRPNVIGIARGSGGGQTLMLNGHIDTVGVAGMTNPFEPYVENGRLYGRGAYDMKGGVAACMLAVRAASQHKLRGDVIFTAVVDEEYAGAGAMTVAGKLLAASYRADGAVIAEATELEMVVAHKGFVWLDIETRGVAAHGSRPDLGVDAIAKMGRVLSGLEHLDRSVRSRMPHGILGTGSLHASLITGGQELSSYPERCVVSVERRTLPGESPEQVQGELQEILNNLAQNDAAFKATIRRGIDRSPLETPQNAPVVSAVNRAAEKVLGHPPAIAGVPYWTDAATLSQFGIPTILFGGIGAGAHAATEWVDLDSLQKCAEIYLQTALEFSR